MTEVQRVKNQHGGYRPGAGRPSPTGEKTHRVRIPVTVSKETVCNIPALQAILDHWESRADDKPRYHYLKQMIEEIRALGF